jgi:hypothetical protein
MAVGEEVMGMTEVTMRDVMAWLLAALESARNDPGDGNGATAALSYRHLWVRLGASPDDLAIKVVCFRSYPCASGSR